ncbi:hypothetical protein KUCAC02_029473, partial [Chaenocephalus aceratus]
AAHRPQRTNPAGGLAGSEAPPAAIVCRRIISSLPLSHQTPTAVSERSFDPAREREAVWTRGPSSRPQGDKAGEWWKFTVNIISVYKQGDNRIRRGDQLLWVRAKDVACKCPKIKPGRKYLLLGTDDDDSPGQSGVVADKGSLLIPWKDLWGRRLRKFQQRDKRGKC